MMCVFRTADGVAVSFGTVVANPLPDGMEAVDVGDITGKVWDPATRTMILGPPPPPDPRLAQLASAVTIADMKEIMQSWL